MLPLGTHAPDTPGGIWPVGILALQGDYQSHAEHITRFFSLPVVFLRKESELLQKFRAIILPGGESSAMLKLMSDGFRETLKQICESGNTPVFATCAGSILAARHVSHPQQYSFNLLSIDVERNGYGRQRDSFQTNNITVESSALSLFPQAQGSFAGIFIRAPKILSVGPDTEVLARHQEDPVLVRGGRHKHIWCATFHPELENTASPIFQSFFAQ